MYGYGLYASCCRGARGVTRLLFGKPRRGLGPEKQMTDASRYLVALAERISAAYVLNTRPRAILLTGSAATGESDYYSDVDLIVYHDDLPSDPDLAKARAAIGVDEVLFVGGTRTA